MLTPKEIEVADLVAAGLPNKVIALQLGISVETVKKHLSRRVQGSGRPAAALVAAALLITTLVPGIAQAVWGPVGVNGAQIDLSNDGYAPNNLTIDGSTEVTGSGFRPLDVALVFECPEGADDLRTECLSLSSAPTDSAGRFSIMNGPADINGYSPIAVQLLEVYSTAASPARSEEDYAKYGVSCLGERAGDVQCVVVAATFDPVTQLPTARADHRICWTSLGYASNLCKPVETGTAPPSTTPTTIAVPGTPPTTAPDVVPTSLPPITVPSPTTIHSYLPPPYPTPVTHVTTTTTLTARPAAPCTLREDAALSQKGPGPDDPNKGGESTSVGDPLWKQETQLTVSPPARQGHTMAYDPGTGQTVLFGGFRHGASDCVLGDTWIWDGATWHQALGPDGAPVPGPPGRYGHAMAFDGRRIVVFGGYDGAVDLDDTWTWDGSRWERHNTPGPSPRARSVMAHHPGSLVDPGDDQALLFGGDRILAGQSQALGDTWTWNAAGRSWTEQAPPAGPAPRSYAQMAYRPGSGVVLHGGWNGGVLGGTFVWDGATWAQTNRPATSPVSHAGAMAHHPPTGMVVLMGGSGGVGSNSPYSGVMGVARRLLDRGQARPAASGPARRHRLLQLGARRDAPAAAKGGLPGLALRP